MNAILNISLSISLYMFVGHICYILYRNFKHVYIPQFPLSYEISFSSVCSALHILLPFSYIKNLSYNLLLSFFYFGLALHFEFLV